MSHQVIVDLFDTIVSRTGSAMGQTIHYMHGHMLEISNVVKELGKSPDIGNRYPLIALKHDFKQKAVSYVGTEVDLTLYIITLSRPEYIAEQRIETIFKPILTPIKDEFINQIARSEMFTQQSIHEVEETLEFYDRLFWGSSSVMGNTANIFGDWVDCIELNFSGLVALEGCNIQFVDHAPNLLSAIAGATGEYIYLSFDKEMIDPSELLGEFQAWSGGLELDLLSITRTINKKVYVLRIDTNGYPFTDSGTLDIAYGKIASENGKLLSLVQQFEIVSGVQL